MLSRALFEVWLVYYEEKDGVHATGRVGDVLGLRDEDIVDQVDNSSPQTYDCTQAHLGLSQSVFLNENVHDCLGEVCLFPIDLCQYSTRLGDPVILGGVKSQLKPEVWSYYLQYEDDLKL